MNERKIDELLGRVQRVDPPPFLFTRIEARLADGGYTAMPRLRLVVVGCGLALLMLANISVLARGSSGVGSSSLSSVVEAMGMIASNQLYHD